MKSVGKRNLVADWSKEVFIISSDLNPNQKIQREKVTFIQDALTSFFGNSYFNVTYTDKSINKIPWIYSLLSNPKNIGCIHALYDIALLIEYSKNLHLPIQKQLEDLKKNPENLRTAFFELFIYRLLDSHHIPNNKKSMDNKQELDGVCQLLGKDYLFECRKSFYPKISELDVMRRLMMDVWNHVTTLKPAVGMIFTITLKRPVQGAHRHQASKQIEKYFSMFGAVKQSVFNRYLDEDEYAKLYAVAYDEATLIETKSQKKYDVLFYIAPPSNPSDRLQTFYQSKVICNFSVYQSQIYKKLESVLREKKRQHRHSAIKDKIIFLDSETLPEFHMNLFQNENMYDPKMVREIYNKVGLKDTVCMIRRAYDNRGPHVFADIITADPFDPIKPILKKMIENSYNILRRKSSITTFPF